MAAFVPRKGFHALDSLPRSYFLGHHRAGLNKMKTMLSLIDLVIECRDYRVPITSRNPLFEYYLAGRPRVILYTKQDLGSEGTRLDRERDHLIEASHFSSSVLFSNCKDPRSVRKVLAFANDHATASDSLTGSKIMIVGMPNVGKSSLLNALRQEGIQKGKAAQTGAQPGVTRKIGTTVKIIEATQERECVYLLDTPGVFVPYVSDAESMLKLALCGSVKDSVIAPVTLADYLLYRINLRHPALYKMFAEPTNDITVLLSALGHKIGRLQKGGTPDLEASAIWFIQRWRGGHLGRFVLDDITSATLEADRIDSSGLGASFSQARRLEKESRRQASKKNLSSG